MRIFMLILMGLGCCLSGCKEPCGCDEKVLPTAPLVTPSAGATRGWPEQAVAYQNVAVHHPPLYLRGYTYECFSEELADRPWNTDDAASFVVSPLDLSLGIVTMPAALAVKPVWQSEQSRGNFPHDCQ